MPLFDSRPVQRVPVHWLMSSLFSWVLRSMTMAHSSAAELNERLSGWVAVWPTDFWGLYPAAEPWGVSWSVILDPELHSRRIRNPKDLWASPSLSAALIWQKNPSANGEKLLHWCEMARKRASRLYLLLRWSDRPQISGRLENADGFEQEDSLLEGESKPATDH